MKKILRSTFGTLVVAAFLAITPPMYARGGHGGGHGGHGGHAVRHAAAGHMKGGHAGSRMRGARGHGHAVFARHAGRTYYATRGGGWGGGSWYPYSGYSRFGYYGLGYGYPYGGYYGYRSGWCYDPYYGYRPCGSYPYRYGYGPYLGFSFGGYQVKSAPLTSARRSNAARVLISHADSILKQHTGSLPLAGYSIAADHFISQQHLS
jgi:hypothetical protein